MVYYCYPHEWWKNTIWKTWHVGDSLLLAFPWIPTIDRWEILAKVPIIFVSPQTKPWWNVVDLFILGLQLGKFHFRAIGASSSGRPQELLRDPGCFAKVTKIEGSPLRFFGFAKKSKVARKDPDTRLRKWVNKGAFYLTVFPLTRQSFACNRLDHPQNAEVNGNKFV